VKTLPPREGSVSNPASEKDPHGGCNDSESSDGFLTRRPFRQRTKPKSISPSPFLISSASSSLKLNKTDSLEVADDVGLGRTMRPALVWLSDCHAFQSDIDHGRQFSVNTPFGVCQKPCVAETGAGCSDRVHRMDAGWAPETFEVYRVERG
jgi:hypothetical protein